MTLKKVVPFELRLTINYVTIEPWIRTPLTTMAVRVKIHIPLKILGFLLMSAFLRPILGGLGQFLYMHFLDLTLGIRFEPVLGGLSRLKEIASHISMQMVRLNEKNNIIYSNSMSEQMRNVEPHARLSGNKIIYPISMNREDLSKLSKEQLINML